MAWVHVTPARGSGAASPREIWDLVTVLTLPLWHQAPRLAQLTWQSLELQMMSLCVSTSVRIRQRLEEMTRTSLSLLFSWNTYILENTNKKYFFPNLNVLTILAPVKTGEERWLSKTFSCTWVTPVLIFYPRNVLVMLINCHLLIEKFWTCKCEQPHVSILPA